MNKKLKLLLLMVILLMVSLFVFLEKDLVYEANMNEEKYNMDLEDALEVSLENKGAPDFILENLASRKISLSDYRGKIVFINFWVSWQELSEYQLLELERLGEENKDLVILAINVREDRELVEKYIESMKLNLNAVNILLDDTGEIGIDYLVGEMPITYFIDDKGCLIDYSDDALDYEELNLILNSIRNKEE